VALLVRLDRLEDPAALGALWEALEARADLSFFQSWLWIGTWLEATGLRPLVLTAHEDGRLVGLGLLTEARPRRHGVLPVRQLVLNEAGQPDLDRLAIEYNGIILARDAATGTLAHILQTLPGDWRELVLGGVPEAYLAVLEAAGLRAEIDRRSASYIVDLAGLRATGRDWLQTRSANSRAQIRQAMRRAERDGPLSITAAATVEQALDFFEGLAALHQSRWQTKGEAGAFGSPFERNFHHRLISIGLGQGRIQLVRVAAGEKIIGYLYNFIHRRHVMNYQGGFRYGDDNRDRPGLVAHALCIGMAGDAGLDRYDLLAGDSRYKRSLADHGESLIWCRAQRPWFAFTLERAARRLKQWAVHERGAAAGSEE